MSLPKGAVRSYIASVRAVRNFCKLEIVYVHIRHFDYIVRSIRSRRLGLHSADLLLSHSV